MGLFEVLSPDLFKPLAGKNRDFFAELLDLVWLRCRRSKDYSMEKAEMVEMAEDYFRGLAMEFELEEQELEFRTRDPHTQALWFLNRLRSCGWLEDLETVYGEAPRTGVRAVNAPILQAFDSVVRPQTVTYSGKLVKAYQLLKTLGQEKSPYENILKEVSAAMDELNSGLRSLNASIGTCMDELTQNKTADELLEAFDQYEKKIVVASYHRFKTSENLFNYRADLQKGLDSCEDEYLNELAEDYCRVEQTEIAEGCAAVLRLVQKVRNDLDEMGLLTQEIDKNHVSYRKRATQRAQFMLLSDGRTQGNINKLLHWYEKTVTDAADLMEEDDGPLSEGWKLYPVDLMGRNFLRTPATPRMLTPIEPLAVPPPLTGEELLEEQRRMQEYAACAVTQENVNLFAESALDGQTAVKASKLAEERPEEFAKLVALHTYSEAEARDYDFEPGEETVHSGGHEFRDFILKRRV